MTFERHKVNKRVLQDLKKRSTFGIFFYMILALIIVLDNNYYQKHLFFSVLFLVSMLGVSLFRLVHMSVSEKMGERYETLNRNIFYISVIASALVWGMAFAAIMIQKDEYAVQLLMPVLICGLCAGGVVAFIPNRKLAIIYNLSMLMPGAVPMLVSKSNTTLAILIILFSVYLMIITYRGNREYWDALENEHLLELKSQELALLSNTDVLTGLYNRRFFDQALDLEWKRSGRNQSILSVIIFDIDHFKNINDTFGHQAGDDFLTNTAATLSAVFKRDYDIVARYGGEEFIVLLPGTNAEQAMQLAEQARQNIEFLILYHQGKKFATTISAGIMCSVADFNTRPDDIVACADKALYHAKQTGRNKIVVFPSMSAENDAPESPASGLA
ncbi:MAG: GGDEF domain-containing protein [Smithella sp.]|nr:GGDEF domain-containing protein [Smithella sp.]